MPDGYGSFWNCAVKQELLHLWTRVSKKKMIGFAVIGAGSVEGPQGVTSMTEAEMNARAASDPYWFSQYSFRFMALCLMHYEDTLRAQDDALRARSRANPGSVYSTYDHPTFHGGSGTDYAGNNPLFRHGGLRRHFGAFGEIGVRIKLFNSLRGADRVTCGMSSGYPRLASLHRRMWGIYVSDRSPWNKIRGIYETYQRYASGAIDRADALAFGLTGALIGFAGLSMRVGAMRAPGPVTSARVPLPGIGPEEIAPARAQPGNTPRILGLNNTDNLARPSRLPSTQAAPEDVPVPYNEVSAAAESGRNPGDPQGLGMANTQRAIDPLGRTEPRIPQTRPGIQEDGSLPPPSPPRPVGGMTAEGIAQANRNWELARSPGSTRVPLSQVEMMTARSQPDGHTMVHMNAGEYFRSWRLAGGTGTPPPFGFRAIGADGAVILTVANVPSPRGMPIE